MPDYVERVGRSYAYMVDTGARSVSADALPVAELPKWSFRGRKAWDLFQCVHFANVRARRVEHVD